MTLLAVDISIPYLADKLTLSPLSRLTWQAASIHHYLLHTKCVALFVLLHIKCATQRLCHHHVQECILILPCKLLIACLCSCAHRLLCGISAASIIDIQIRSQRVQSNFDVFACQNNAAAEAAAFLKSLMLR
jgi:hypothetical protein